MTRPDLGAGICSIARTLDWVGEPWTLLIVREAFFGTQQFTEFERNLGIAKNVLSARLRKLVEADILDRTAVSGRGNPQLYALTDKGRDLFPVLIALMQWGDRWIAQGKAPVRVVNRKTQAEIAPMNLRDGRGRVLSSKDLAILPGPGANRAIARRFGGKAAAPKVGVEK
jgi:DNA-binding HxlR family transcriptional regulator